MHIKKICVISQYYPTENDMIFSFLDKLISQFADMKIECHVITPMSIFESKHRGKSRVKKTIKENSIFIYCPSYVQYPHRKIFGFDTYRLTMRSYTTSIEKTYRKYIGEVDIFYSHFLNPSGIAASIIGIRNNIPVFVAVGESSFESHNFAYKLYKKEIQKGIIGVIAVSTENKNKLLSLGLFDEKFLNSIAVFPNAVDKSQFYTMDKKQAREALSIKNEQFVISFVGHFNERKGIIRLVKALEKNKSWYGIFIGDGDIKPVYNRTIYKGVVKNSELPMYLSASDVFVLPTIAEGSCNAIIEALACGLPVISSDKKFNDDVLDEQCSIRIDTTNVDSIYLAIDRLWKDDTLRLKMAKRANEKSENFDIKVRAERIITFINYILSKRE